MCGEYARSLEGDDFYQNSVYCDCRERLDNKKNMVLKNYLMIK